MLPIAIGRSAKRGVSGHDSSPPLIHGSALPGLQIKTSTLAFIWTEDLLAPKIFWKPLLYSINWLWGSWNCSSELCCLSIFLGIRAANGGNIVTGWLEASAGMGKKRLGGNQSPGQEDIRVRLDRQGKDRVKYKSPSQCWEICGQSRWGHSKVWGWVGGTSSSNRGLVAVQLAQLEKVGTAALGNWAMWQSTSSPDGVGHHLGCIISGIPRLQEPNFTLCP